MSTDYLGAGLYVEHRRARHADYCWKCDVPWPCPTIAALIDADHEWAQWRDKWCATLDLVGNANERLVWAENALRSIAANTCCGTCQEAARVAQRALDGEPVGRLPE